MAEFINRGFGRKRESDRSERIPPGQYETSDFPVLTAGPTPRIPLSDWTFSLDGLVESPVQWTWEQLNELPHQAFHHDIHCVTKWSKLDTNWEGVSIDTLLEHVTLKPEAKYVMAYSYGNYTTNLPLSDIQGRQSLHRNALRGTALGSRTWRPRKAGRTAPIFLEKCQVD